MYDVKPTPEEIIDALDTIRELCSWNRTFKCCEKCPLYSDPYNGCILQSKFPWTWKLNDRYESWKAVLNDK